MTINQLGDIFEGWRNLVFKDIDVEKIAIPRMGVCSTCDIRTDGKCDKLKGGCGCTIKSKTRCVKCKCPLDKW